MASLEKRNGTYRILFRYCGSKFSRSLKTKSEVQAKAALARLVDNCQRLELGTLTLPDNADIVSFLLSDGRQSEKPTIPKIRTLKQLCDAFFTDLPQGSIEVSTVDGMKTHAGHLQRVLGSTFALNSLDFHCLQRYIDTRAKDAGRRGRTVRSVTIKKDIVTLTTIWSWAKRMGYVTNTFPKKGLMYPKTSEKSEFQTLCQIKRRITRGGLSKAEIADLWESVFLTREEIEQLLKEVKSIARHRFIYPLFVFAAHTGARRSELIRSEIDDFDMEAGVVTIHEKKRVRGKNTTRKVPMSPLLTTAMTEWFAGHPGGIYTFCQTPDVVRSKSVRTAPTPLTQFEAHGYFKRTIARTEFKMLQGWHVFRHSFCSNCAASGIDQRMINGWVGHQTEAMVKRYRHLFPSKEHAAITAVFGNPQKETD